MFHCPNCGGQVIFDIPSQQMKCLYCGTLTPPQQYNVNNEVKESTYETNVYVCRNCGAELTSPDEQMVSFCSYCGAEAVLAGKVTSENKPQELIPFRISKQQCQNIYRDKIKKALFLPKELKDEQFLQQFRGIFIPFWSIKVDFPKGATQTAYSDTHLHGNQYKHTTYLLNVQAYHNKSRFMRDGSSSLDDAISDAIDDYSDKIVPFNSAYLAGFYADRADVPAEQYRMDVLDEAKEEAGDALKAELSRNNMHHLPKVSPSILRKRGIDTTHFKVSPLLNDTFLPLCKDFYGRLLPVWFLTWRKKDRVSYVVMNGETGTMYTELPVEKKTYLLAAGILAVVLFAVLSLFLTTVPPTTMGISALVALINLYLFKGEIQHLMEKELHLRDIGSKEYDPKRDQLRKKVKKRYTLGIGVPVTALVLIGLFFLYFGDEIETTQYTFMNLTVFPATIFALIFVIRGSIDAARLKEKSMLVWVILNAAAIFACTAIAVIRPVQDWWYSAGSAICLAATLIPALKLIDIFNLMATRPLPSFFGREGANHGLKD